MSRYINMDFRMTEALLLFWFAPVIAVVILKCGISFIKNIYTKSNDKRKTITKMGMEN